MDNTIESWEQEIIEESVKDDVKSASKMISTLYCHMIKYKYCSNNYQDSQWDETVTRNSNYFNNGTINTSKNVINRLDLEKLFKNGIKDAEGETKKFNQHILTKEIPSHPVDDLGNGETLDWLDIRDISNSNKINKWLEVNRKAKWHDK